MDFVDKKKQVILVMLSFHHLKQLKSPFFPSLRCSPWNSWLFRVSWTRPCVFCTCTSVPVCGCEGVTMVPLSLLEIRNCLINNLLVISSVFSLMTTDSSSTRHLISRCQISSDQSFLSLWRMFCTCHCFFSSSLQLSLPLPIKVIIINYSACTYQIILVISFCFSLFDMFL